MAKTDQERREQALEKLAEIGGKLRTDEDIVRHGTKYVLPNNSTLDQDIEFLNKRRNDEESDVSWNRTFPYRPWDGARATKLAIEEIAGFALGQTLYSFFGRQLPQFITINTGPKQEDREDVPWGAMAIPGMKGVTINLGQGRDPELGQVFQINAEGPRKWRHHISGLFDLIEQKLRTNSIYKGKAIDGAEAFIDVSVVDPADVVYTESVQRRLEGDVWSFIKHESLLEKLGHGGKFAVLFDGPYGTGKSLAALLTAQVAVEHGWTFLMCRPGKDNLVQTLELARMYQPAVVFGEDIDTMAGAGSGNAIERHLDMLDGIKTKGLKLVAVFTTNHAGDIHQGMLRPGRIGAVIRIGAMDREGVERLGRRVIGEALMEDTNWDKVWEHVDGYMPAFVREVFDRSVRYAITLNDGVLGPIGTEAICLAADSLRDQHELMEGAKEEVRSADLASALERVVVDAVHGVAILDNNEDQVFSLAGKTDH
jgi:transitional endoplasmic reticulum ATPase